MISTGSLRKQPIFFATPPQVSVRNDVWGTSVEIPYWWRVTYQIWVLLLIVKANFPRGTTNQKHYPDPLSSTEAPAGYPYKNSNKRKKKRKHAGDDRAPRASPQLQHNEASAEEKDPDLGSEASSVQNYCARFSNVIPRGNQRWRREMSAVFSG